MCIKTRFLLTSLLFLLIMSPASRVSTAHHESISRPMVSQRVVPLARFSSVELRNGGRVFVRHGAMQRVTLLKGSTAFTHITVGGGDRLVIDKCPGKCPRGYELEIEVVAPDIAGISIVDGGTIEVLGSFPGREGMNVAVSQGGTIDIRSLTVDSVTASVDQGGIIFTKPRNAMIASVRHGGIITYWGDPQVTSSVQHGGVVSKGTADDAEKPLSDLFPSFQYATPTPPSPPVPVQRLHPVN